MVWVLLANNANNNKTNDCIMRLENLELRLLGPQTGMSVFGDNSYIGNYCSVHELMLDLIYQLNIENLDEIVKKFTSLNQYTIEPYRYRGVCSEMFWPTDTIFRYIYYSDSLSDLFKKFEIHEKRATQCSKHFYYGPQGTGIHLFDKNKLKYEFWIGGNEIHTVSDVMNEIKRQGLPIPSMLYDEFNESVTDEAAVYDVFISHKSDDYRIAKKVHDVLSDAGLKVFLSEIELPAIANADYTAEISKALDNSRHMLVVASNVENINTGWVRYEWGSFLNEKLSGRKDGNIITLITNNVRIEELPMGLRQYQAINIQDIASLARWLPKL